MWNIESKGNIAKKRFSDFNTDYEERAHILKLIKLRKKW